MPELELLGSAKRDMHNVRSPGIGGLAHRCRCSAAPLCQSSCGAERDLQNLRGLPGSTDSRAASCKRQPRAFSAALSSQMPEHQNHSRAQPAGPICIGTMRHGGPAQNASRVTAVTSPSGSMAQK